MINYILHIKKSYGVNNFASLTETIAISGLESYPGYLDKLLNIIDTSFKRIYNENIESIIEEEDRLELKEQFRQYINFLDSITKDDITINVIDEVIERTIHMDKI